MTKQYKHILVPLDGSELAETALDDAVSVAESSHADITLLQVIPTIEEVLGSGTDHPIYIDEQWASKRANAVDYLNKVHKQLHCKEVEVHPAVEMGSAAEIIIDYAHDHPVDLIVMATHGRSGLKRWVYGSVADKVLRGADVPVLLIRAHSESLAV